VKGDTTLNGITDAEDAAKVLIYAAEDGAGIETRICQMDTSEMEDLGITGLAVDEMEDFVYFLSDVTGESEDHGKTSNIPDETGKSPLDAEDAAKILIYAADAGIGEEDWYKILSPRPKYTEAIGPRDTWPAE
jgi:hypothetical protein